VFVVLYSKIACAAAFGLIVACCTCQLHDICPFCCCGNQLADEFTSLRVPYIPRRKMVVTALRALPGPECSWHPSVFHLKRCNTVGSKPTFGRWG
jgi:hypothetical protein